MKKLNELKEMVSRLEVDCEKFYKKGNKAASVRARKVLQEIRLQAHEMRKDISEVRKTFS
tara:strand:- start:8935 stop:9114 length:180 start_codon:yes stop_codon:yes gene_type:complete